MSGGNVAVVREMYDAFHSGDAERAMDHFAPDVRVDARDTQMPRMAGGAMLS